MRRPFNGAWETLFSNEKEPCDKMTTSKETLPHGFVFGEKEEASQKPAGTDGHTSLSSSP